MAERWKKAKVSIRTKSGTIELPAEVYGCFAVHEPDCGAEAFTVTHLPTGCALGRGLGWFSTAFKAKRTVLAIAEHFPDAVRWSDLSAEAFKDVGTRLTALCNARDLFGDVEAMLGPVMKARKGGLNGYGAGRTAA